MPSQNLAKMHMTPADKALSASLINQLLAVYAPYLRNLSPKENKKYGRINETKKLVVNKVNDYHQTNAALQIPDVDWVEFDLDFDSRKHFETTAIKLMGLAKAMTETRRIHDHDNFVNAMIDYHFAQYKDRTEQGTGYDSKVEEIKKCFSKKRKSTLSDGIDPI
jgi:hypothetical protein